MMDIEKLIERLKKASADGSWNTLADYAHKAATALSTLQAENGKLRDELEQVKNERDSAKATAKLPDLETWAKEAGERGAQYALKYLEEEYGVSIRRLIELAQADREGRCVVLEKRCNDG